MLTLFGKLVPMSQQFHTLQLKDIQKTTDDCSVLTLDVPKELQATFAYKPGQYLTFKKEINGEELRRSYSLCSCPLDNEWKVAVKKIEDGRFSSFVNDSLKVGEMLEVMPPNGRFTKEAEKDVAKEYVAFAAGSGITPIYSIIDTLLRKEPNCRVHLFYLNKTVSSIILREEIEALKNKYLKNFELHYFLTQEFRDSPLFDGRIDKTKLEQIFSKMIDPNSINDFFICGPTEMIFLIRDFLVERNVEEGKVHFELFNTPTGKKKKIDISTASGESEVSITLNGTKTFFKMGQGGENILDAALRNNADLPFACKGGVCCTCKAKLMEGDVQMDINYALEPEEVEQGYILTCQAVPKTKNIVVDFDS